MVLIFVLVTDRTPKLERLFLLGSFRITVKDFAKAICCWTNVRYVSLEKIEELFLTRIIEEIGKNCSELSILHCKCYSQVLTHGEETDF